MEKSNLIEVYENALSNEICDYMINSMEVNKQMAYNGITSSGLDTKIKQSTDFNLLDAINIDPNVDNIIIPGLKASLENHIIKYVKKYNVLETSKIFDETVIWNASIHMKRYTKGIDGYHSWHEDNGSGFPTISRMLVLMYYLNSVEEGGETEFKYQNLKIKPTKGSLVIFPAYFTHTHKGHVPISNDKYICNLWLLKRNKTIDRAITSMKHEFSKLININNYGI